jgi:hypothetical protein
MPINVHDNPVSPELCEAARIWLLSQSPIFGWRAHASALGTFWHRNFVLPGTHLHHYDQGAWNPAMTYEAFVAADSPLAHVADIVRHQHFDGEPFTRIWANFQSFGDESAFHRDFPAQFAASARTAVWYPVSQWERDWGGDFVTLDPKGEVDACALVKPNRLVVFNGTQAHAARPISRYCGELRIAVSFATEVVGDKGLEVDHA